MKPLHRVLVAIAVVVAAPAFAVESVYLDSVPVTNPGEYLAPANLYFQVPPPSAYFDTAGSLVPASVYDIGIISNQSGPSMASGSTTGYSSYAISSESEAEATDSKLRVLITAGLDHASDIPVGVMREHFAESEVIDVVSEGEIYDVLVEVETMKLPYSPTVFVVVNAYKDVDDQSLIFYNNFGYLGELKLLSGSVSYAVNLETALLEEAERLQD